MTDNRNGCAPCANSKYVKCTIVKKVCVGTPIRSVKSSTNLSFSDLTNISQTIVTLTNTDPQQQIDGFVLGLGNLAEYLVQIKVGDKYQALKILVLHDGSTAKMVEYAVVRTDDDLGDFCVEVVDGSAVLKFSPTYENSSVTYTRILNE
jgi:hypothetical protein